jgi:hypothetical protein
MTFGLRGFTAAVVGSFPPRPVRTSVAAATPVGESAVIVSVMSSDTADRMRRRSIPTVDLVI